jgi:flagellar biosynthesis chaperone FliJ
VTPLLQKNLNNFVHELGDLIHRDENELHKLNQAKNSLRVKCEKIKNQLDYICDREKKVSGSIMDLKEKESQKSIDELVANHFIRKAYD